MYHLQNIHTITNMSTTHNNDTQNNDMLVVKNVNKKDSCKQ